MDNEKLNNASYETTKLNDNLEQQGNDTEQHIENNNEKESSRHEAAETARQEIERVTHEKEPTEDPEKETEAKAANTPKRTKITQKNAYASIVQQTQSELSAPSRAFSKIIHAPVIEKISETAAKTIARPNAILIGSILAFSLTLAVYLIARYNGYPLSGTETIAAFVIGWILGIVYDFFRAMITGGGN